MKSLPRNLLLVVTTLVVTLTALFLWRQDPLLAERRALYGDLAQWLRDNALPGETVAVQQAGLAEYLAGHPTAPLPEDADAPALVAALDRERPDYCIAVNSLAWQTVRAQPWFQERYRPVYQVANPYDAATPLTVFRYTPSPFDAGEAVSTTVAFVSAAGERLELAGYRLDSRRIAPGEPLHLTLHWRAPAAIHEPLTLILRLVDAADERVWWQAENRAPAGLATDLWNAGMQVDDRYLVTPPADLPPGEYVLDVAAHRPNGQSLAISDGEAARFILARVSRPPAVSTVPPTPDHPLHAAFGDEIELLGYDVAARVAPDRTLRVALYWRALQPVPVNYKVFVHLLGSDGQLRAQDDSLPVGWTYPTTRWQPGEFIRDEHLLALGPDTPRGDYRLFVGLYDAETGERPPVCDEAGNEVADRRVFLQVIEVR